MSLRLSARFVLVAISLCVTLSAPAFGQYGGGGSGGTGTAGGTGTNGGSYGSGAAIGAGAAVAAGAVVAYMVLHKTTLIGCVEQASDGIKMMNEKDKKTYAIDANGQDVKAGERIEVKGKTSKDASGLKTLHVKAFKDMGSCSPVQAQATQKQ